MILQLVYTSRRTASFSAEALQDVIAHSEDRNRARGLTGALLCCGPHIMQLLEGEATAVDDLFARIAADPRHSHVTCLLHKSVNRRLFPEWGMLLADLASDVPICADRLARLIGQVQANNDTSGLTVESRILINDFKLQVACG